MSSSKDIVETVESAFTKITEVVDLSFFPAGAACLAAVVFWEQKAHFFDLQLPLGFQVAGAILASYILGLICFSGGRLLRYSITGKGSSPSQQKLSASIEKICQSHGLDLAYLTYFHGDHAQPTRLYTRLWAELRQRPELGPSYALLRRYWVMSATYDGLTLALLVWAGVLLCWWLGLGVPQPENRHGAPVMAAIAVGMSVLSGREAYRHYRNQIEELVGSVAAYYDCLPDRGPSPSPRNNDHGK